MERFRSMRLWRGAAVAGWLILAGCAGAPAPKPPPPAPSKATQAPPPPPLSPFADAPVSFLIRGSFARGELVIVRVCLKPDRSIESATVLESSGDRRFDELAVDWARRVRLRELPANGAPLARCGAVRVELRDPDELRLLGSPGSGLG